MTSSPNKALAFGLTPLLQRPSASSTTPLHQDKSATRSAVASPPHEQTRCAPAKDKEVTFPNNQPDSDPKTAVVSQRGAHRLRFWHGPV